MKNDFQQKDKSIITSLTGTSIHQMMGRKNSLSFKETGKKNFSEKSFERHLLSGVRQSETSSRQKIMSRRYETLTAGQDYKKRESKKSKSFSNNIYFPHKNFAQINETTQQKPVKNIIRLKNKSESGLNKLHTSLNNIPPSNNQEQRLNMVLHRSQTEVEDQKVSFLTKLNLQKRNKIMEIYRPAPTKEFAKSRKVKLQQSEKISQQKKRKESTEEKRKNEYFLDSQQMFTIKQKKGTEIISTKVKSQQQLEESHFRPSLITHLIIDHPIKKPVKTIESIEKQKNIENKIKLFTEVNETNPNKKEIEQQKTVNEKKEPSFFKSKYQKPKIQETTNEKTIPQKPSEQKFSLPRYTDFYDNYVSSGELKNSEKHRPRTLVRNEKITQEVQKMMNSSYSPMISGLKINSITPRNVEEPCPNSAKQQNQQNYPATDDSLNTIHLQKLKTQLLQSNRYTPKLKLFNEFFSDSYNFAKQNFKIVKINQGTYFGEINEQKIPHGVGIIFYKSAKLFEGHFLNGLKEGQGFEIYPDGSFFLGNYSNNKKNGKGRFQWLNGQIYDGEWLNDKKHGSGQWKADNIISYVGEWKENKIEGFGILIEGEERYEGQFLNFAKQGHGTYRYQNGEVYTGNFRNNRLNGEGEYFWPNSDHYKGEFLNNKRHGRGTLYLAMQNILYRGQFRNDKKCGFGEETYRQKIKYVGNFENDLKHGWGILKRVVSSEDGDEEVIYQGYWVNNQTIEMSDTPVDEFEMIEEDEAEFCKNELSKSKLKKLPEPKEKAVSKLKTSPYKTRSVSKKLIPQLDMKPKESIGLKGRSRYMRINNHYIQKSIQGSKTNLHQKSIERLQRSRSGERVLKRDQSNQSMSRHHRDCLCDHEG